MVIYSFVSLLCLRDRWQGKGLIKNSSQPRESQIHTKTLIAGQTVQDILQKTYQEDMQTIHVKGLFSLVSISFVQSIVSFKLT